MIKEYYIEAGWNTRGISIEQLDGVESFLSSLGDIKYRGHGGTCVTYKKPHATVVIKACLKNNGIMKSSEEFIKHSKMLQSHGIKLLPPLEILYEDDLFFVYTQQRCKLMGEVTPLSTISMFEIIKQMINKRVLVPDLYYKNFGVYNNEIYLYDYHDYSDFLTDNKYYICHIAHLMNKCKRGEDVINVSLTLNELININFGKGILDDIEISLLKALYNAEYEAAVVIISNYILVLRKRVVKSYADYQFINIDQYGTILLDSHTREKYNFAKNLINTVFGEESFTLVDFGCSLGGIGSKLAQQHPLSHITLNNITQKEIDVCRTIQRTLMLSNIKVITTNVLEVKNSYDVTMYFAVIHHLLKHKTFDEVMEIVLAQTKKYSIIELPFGDDSLLKKVIADSSSTYELSYSALETLEKFENKISGYFKVLNKQKINYGGNDLNRYAYTLEKIIA